jgi:carbonic anhydrase
VARGFDLAGITNPVGVPVSSRFCEECGSKRSVTPSKQFRAGKDTVVFGLTRRTISGLLVVVGLIRTFQQRRTHMNTLDSMLKRNRDFAAQQSAAGTLVNSLPRALPNVKAIIIGCADMRVDPAYVLGIKPGEAVVIRNIGGRITPGLLEQLGLLGRIGEVAGEVPGGGGEFHIIVLQHTDCGMTRLAGDPARLAQYFQIPEVELRKKAVSDPRAAVAADVAALRAIPALPSTWLISGLVYDVATGLVEIVVPPVSLRAA